MGTVFKALDINLNRHVALKVIRKEFSSDPVHLKKFEEEARITALVNHPNVVKVFSFGSDHGVLFIAMELADHGNLDEMLTLQGRIPEAKALVVGIQIAEGLRAAHRRGLIHRDVKPGNILFTDDDTAKVVDFGLACLVQEQAEDRGEIWGTPYYVTPEKLNHEPEDYRSDIYSLGGTLFHAISGRPPHEAETVSVVELQKIKSKPVNLQAYAPEVSTATAIVINRMLQQDPAQRYESYGELVEDLTYSLNKLSQPAGGSHPARQADGLEPGSWKRILTWSALLLLVLVAGVFFLGLALVVFHHKPPAKDDVTPAEMTRETTNVDGSYEEARKLILKGDDAGAKKSLADLASKPNLPQPLGRWILLQQGLAGLLSGDAGGARDAFRKLQQHGLYSLDPEEKVLANFFVETGRVVAEGNPVPPSDIKNYNPGDCEAFGFFIFALDDWQMSDFDDAGPLLRAFLDSDPQPPFDWISEYKPLAKQYEASLETYQKISAQIAGADNLQKKKTALEDLRALSAAHPIRGKLRLKLQQLQDILEKKIADEQAVEAQKRAAELAVVKEEQGKTLDQAKAKFAELVGAMQFDAALAAARGGGQFSFPELEKERLAMVKKAQWLAQFKSQLIRDLTVTGYPQQIVKSSGATISGIAHKATETQVEVQTPYGSMAVQWSEMSPATILSLANYFTQINANNPAVADRLWVSGVFAILNGMQSQGTVLLNNAADKKAEYRDQLPIFTETPKP